MKRLFNIIPAIIIFAGLFASCTSNDEEKDNNKSSENRGAYIINYGNFGAGNATITKYDFDNDQTTRFYYEMQNDKKIGASVQWAYKYDKSVYLITDSPDMILITDESFTVTDTIIGITDNPRNCVADGNYLYISCWGADPDWVVMPNSYVLKYNIKDETYSKIAIPGGCEGLEVANGKLYVALNYATNIAAIDLATENISYIETGSKSAYFVKDKLNNLYVSLVDGENKGLGYINTTTNEVSYYKLETISAGGYAKSLDISKDGSKLYAISASYDESWNLVGGVSTFDTASKKFDEKQIVSEVTGIKSLSVNPENNHLYVFVSNGAVDNGEMRIYKNGELKNTHEVGAEPTVTVYIE